MGGLWHCCSHIIGYQWDLWRLMMNDDEWIYNIILVGGFNPSEKYESQLG